MNELHNTVAGLWRSMDGGEWTLVGLYGGTYDEARDKAKLALIKDIDVWTWPVQYRLSFELVQ